MNFLFHSFVEENRTQNKLIPLRILSSVVEQLLSSASDKVSKSMPVQIVFSKFRNGTQIKAAQIAMTNFRK